MYKPLEQSQPAGWGPARALSHAFVVHEPVVEASKIGVNGTRDSVPQRHMALHLHTASG